MLGWNVRVSHVRVGNVSSWHVMCHIFNLENPGIILNGMFYGILISKTGIKITIDPCQKDL